MSPIADTLGALYDLRSEAFWAWAAFGLAPVLVSALASVSLQGPLRSRLAFTLSSAARLLGWPALAVGLIGLPWFVFEMYLVPVLMDAYPISRSILAAPLFLTQWLAHLWFVVLPPAWMAWLLLGCLRFRRSWRDGQGTA